MFQRESQRAAHVLTVIGPPIPIEAPPSDSTVTRPTTSSRDRARSTAQSNPSGRRTVLRLLEVCGAAESDIQTVLIDGWRIVDQGSSCSRNDDVDGFSYLLSDLVKLGTAV
jgi:hypothetical protein